MPGMNSGLSDTNATLVAAFRAALLHQGLIVAAILAVLALAWLAIREWAPGARINRHQVATLSGSEPVARRLLRIGFGLIWIFDGLLQGQPAMAAGLPSKVIEPAAASSPLWVQHVVNWAGTSWSYHPVQAGAAAVWIQVGIGVWLLVAPAGWSSRLAGLASAVWGLVVWVFGEAFGGILSPGQTFLFGAPGAALLYAAAGLLIALPLAHWQSGRLGRVLASVLGLFFLAMAILQAWPGRGFWQGRLHGQPGTLAGMATSMASTPQPHVLSALVSGFAAADAGHGALINLAAVIALAVIGAAFLTGRPRLIRPVLIVLLVLCLADWVLIEDLGFLGGLGTDPNSMIPIALLAVAGYCALGPSPAPELAAPTVTSSDQVAAGRWRPAQLVRAFASASAPALLALWAVVIVLVGAIPMAAAEASTTASPILAEAIDGNSAPLNFAAPGFTLTDQDGAKVSLASLHGKVVLLTFLDPVCTSDCPVIAQEFRAADQLLGATARRVELVAIVANPIYHSLAYTRAFDRQERLDGLTNWLFLTGSVSQLQQAWKGYAVAAQVLPAGGMIAHSDVTYLIDAAGRTRAELNFDPGPGTASTQSSFAAELATEARQLAGPA